MNQDLSIFVIIIIKEYDEKDSMLFYQQMGLVSHFVLAFEWIDIQPSVLSVSSQRCLI